MSTPVRIGILGNSFARKVQLPALRAVREDAPHEVVALCGHDRARALDTAREWSIPVGTADMDELVEQRPELVLVTTPVDLHAPMVRTLIEALPGAAVLCEKPFTLDAVEAEELVRLARGRLALVHHQLRWSPERRRMRAMIEEGFVGAPRRAHVELCLGSRAHLERPWCWWHDEARGGGVLGAIGSHLVDGVRWLLGEVESVQGSLSTFVTQRADAQGRVHRVTEDDHAEAWLPLESGALCTLTTSIVMVHARPHGVEVHGEEGALRLEGEERLFAGKLDGEWARVEVEPLPVLAPELASPFARQEPAFLRDLVHAVASRRRELPLAATFEDGLATQHVLDAIRRSSAAEHWIPCSV